VKDAGLRCARVGAPENLEIHTRCTEAENAHDLSQHRDFLHEDITVVVAGGMATTGIDEYRAGLEQLFEGMSDFKVVLEDQFATDDRVVCRWRATATHDGDYFGIPATGSTVDYTGVSVWEFDGGKARRGWIFPDNVTMMQQLGVA
jgi:steroid delta-isomerase-like uncharacterized protein